MMVTHTYTILTVSAATFEEIAKKLRWAGYSHVFNEAGHMDMHGIALARTTEEAGRDESMRPAQ